MSDPIETRIQLTGEAEYKASLRNINAELKVNYAQMGLVAEQYDSNADSEAALASKNAALGETITTLVEKTALLQDEISKRKKKDDELTSAIASQREKAMALQTQLESAVKAYGEDSEAAAGYKAQLAELDRSTAKLEAAQLSNNTEMANTSAAMLKTKAAAEKAKNELGNLEAKSETTKKAGAELAEKVQTLAEKFGVHLPKGVSQTLGAMQGLISPTALAAGGIVALGAAAAKAYEKLTDLAKQGASWADDLLTTADKTGVTVSELQKFGDVSELVDVSTETLASSLGKLKVKIGEGDDSLQKLAKASNSVIDTNGSAYDTFLQCIDALGKVSDENERAALSQDIFGKSYQDLEPLIKKGSSALDDYQSGLNQSLIPTEDEIDALGSLDDALQTANTNQENLGRKMASVLAPSMENLTESTDGYSGTLGDLGETILPLVCDAIDFAADGIKTVQPLIDTVALALEGVAITIQAVITGIAYLTALLDGGAKSWKDYYNNIDRFDTMSGAMSNTLGRITGSVGAYATGTTSASDGLALVGEHGPELVDFGGGETVYTAGQTRGLLSGKSDNYVINITIDAKNVREMNDVIAIAKREAVSIRQGVSTN